MSAEKVIGQSTCSLMRNALLVAVCVPLIVLVGCGEDQSGGSAPSASPSAITAHDDFAAVMPELHRYGESEHFIFWTTLDDPDPTWVKLAEDSVGYTRRRLRAKSALSRAAVFFLRSREEVGRLAVHLRPGSRTTRSAFFCKIPAVVILVSSRVARTVIHETTHYVVYGLATRVPCAIHEGVATFVAEELLAIKGVFVAHLKRRRAMKLARVQDLPSLKELVEMSYDEFLEEEAAYQLSWCLGKVLLNRKSPWPQRLTEFFEGVDRTDAWTSLVRTYPLEEIEGEWKAEFSRQRSGE